MRVPQNVGEWRVFWALWLPLFLFLTALASVLFSGCGVVTYERGNVKPPTPRPDDVVMVGCTAGQRVEWVDAGRYLHGRFECR
jgi:hypothetical protein